MAAILLVQNFRTGLRLEKALKSSLADIKNIGMGLDHMIWQLKK